MHHWCTLIHQSELKLHMCLRPLTLFLQTELNLSTIVLSFLLSFAFSMLVEAPTLGLEKAVLGRIFGKRKWPFARRSDLFGRGGYQRQEKFSDLWQWEVIFGKRKWLLAREGNLWREVVVFSKSFLARLSHCWQEGMICRGKDQWSV